jgi:hypothetical protein
MRAPGSRKNFSLQAEISGFLLWQDWKRGTRNELLVVRCKNYVGINYLDQKAAIFMLLRRYYVKWDEIKGSS